MSCAVAGCKSHTSRNKDKQQIVTFHRFPKDPVMKNEWIKCIRRRNWCPKKHSHVCSKHFTSNSFVCEMAFKWRRLKEDAVPTLFIMHGMDEMTDYEKICEQVHSMPLQIHGNPQNQQSSIYNAEQTDYGKIREEDHSMPLQIHGTPQHQQSSIYHAGEQIKDPLAVEVKTEPVTSEINVRLPVTSCDRLAHQNREPKYMKKIKMLERQLQRVKAVSKRRLRKINSLSKALSRLRKRNEDLVNIVNILND